MNKRFVICPIFILLLSLSAWPQGIRKPVWAGQFYDSRPDVLSAQIEGFLDSAETKAPRLDGLRSLIAPHAGYPYSGRVAAYAYKKALGMPFDTVVIVGTSHRHGFRGCSIYMEGGYETPLGTAVIDEETASRLSKATGFRYVPAAHREEHSVEVHVPFIQKILPSAKIVPVVMGYPERKTITTLADGLYEASRSTQILVVASTDLSHFHTKEEADRIDGRTISWIESQDTATLIRKLEQGDPIMCGGGPVVSILLYSQKFGPASVEILKHADSSAASGDNSRVVGYLAAAIHTAAEEASFQLSPDERETLLEIARKSIRAFVQDKIILEFTSSQPLLNTKKGAFVTLKKKGRLRGCIGFIDPILPLQRTIAQAAVSAASRDMRFPPVTSEELEELEIEISVLSPLRKISNTDRVRVGTHGLLIQKGKNAGLLLPQVATENRWSSKKFLEQTCKKAGLPPDAWKSGADIYVFEAVVFH